MEGEQFSYGPQVPGARRGYSLEEEREELALIEQAAKEYTIKNPEFVRAIQEDINQLDFRELQKIFTDFAIKSGIPEKSTNFVPRERIYIVHSLVRGMMAYVPEANAILINGDALKSLIPTGNPFGRFLLIFRSLLHEYAHATGSTGKEINEHTNMQYENAGFHLMKKSIYKNNYESQLFDALNEGITEEISMRAAQLYLDRRAFELVEGDPISKEEYQELFMSFVDKSYVSFRFFADRLCGHIAELCEVPKDVVWNGFISGYCRGIEFPKELIDEMVGEDFTTELANVDSEEKLQKIIERYQFPPTDEKLRQRLANILAKGW